MKRPAVAISSQRGLPPARGLPILVIGTAAAPRSSGAVPLADVDLVPVGSRLRARLKLLKCEPIDRNGVQMTWEVAVEREGSSKLACVAESISRRYP